MPSAPYRNGVHVDAVLSNISIAYMQDNDTYIANKVFPNVNVSKASGKFYKYDQGDWLRDEAQKRADATESAGSGYTVGTDSYSTDVWAFHKDVGQQVIANSDSQLSPMADAARFVAGRLLLRQERKFANDFFKTGVWATDLTGTATGSGANEFTQFSDYVNSDPLAEIEAAKEAVAGVTGLDVNTMVMGKQVYNVLKQHPIFTDRTKYTSSENTSLELMARFFEVDRIFVARSLYNAAAEGQTADIKYNFGKGLLMAHVATSPGLLTPSAGYTFTWDGVSDGAGLDVGTVQIDMPQLRATRVESQVAWDNKVVAPNLGVFMTDVVA